MTHKHLSDRCNNYTEYPDGHGITINETENSLERYKAEVSRTPLKLSDNSMKLFNCQTSNSLRRKKNIAFKAIIYLDLGVNDSSG